MSDDKQSAASESLDETIDASSASAGAIDGGQTDGNESHTSAEGSAHENGSSDPTADLLGQTLDDFQIERRLGRGGFSDVYLAEQRSLKRKVALKVLRPEKMESEQELLRFKREAMATAPIHHPNIVGVIVVGECQGVHYIAMEYVEGLTLREYLDKRGPLDFPTLLAIMRRVITALQRAHEEGLIHRDIKPENVLLTKKGEVKVADFGLAHHVTRKDLQTHEAGVTMGTPLYMSPEQVQGKDLDHRSDQYSFGVMCYHLLTGTPPFKGETPMAVALKHVRAAPEPIQKLRAEVPLPFVRLVDRMMAKRPAQRFASPQALLDALNDVREQVYLSGDHQAPSDGDDDDFRIIDDYSSMGYRGFRLSARLQQWWRSPIIRSAMIASSLLLACGAGLAVGQYQRGQVPKPPESDPALQVPELADSERQGTGWLQLLYAENVARYQPEASYWAVLQWYPEERRACDEAAVVLFDYYLQHDDPMRAQMVADQLMSRPREGQRFLGHLMSAILASRHGQAKESAELFRQLNDVSDGETELSAERFRILAEYIWRADRKNQALLGQPVFKKPLSQWIRQHFKLSIPPA